MYVTSSVHIEVMWQFEYTYVHTYFNNTYVISEELREMQIHQYMQVTFMSIRIWKAVKIGLSLISIYILVMFNHFDAIFRHIYTLNIHMF